MQCIDPAKFENKKYDTVEFGSFGSPCPQVFKFLFVRKLIKSRLANRTFLAKMFSVSRTTIRNWYVKGEEYEKIELN